MEQHTTDQAALAAKFINYTHKHVFLTGKAGTGKTTFLRSIIQQTHKRAIIVAPTGIAAINAGGVTIHSMFQLPFGSFVPVNNSGLTSTSFDKRFSDPVTLIRNQQMNETKRKILRDLELLIIDEVSMLRADLLDAIDVVLKHVRRKPQLPFGGVQVLFIGDLMQLPPVVKDEEWRSLKQYYNSVYFFDAHCLQVERPVYVELNKIYRQQDDVFIGLLNNLRNNKISSTDTQLLNQYFKPSFKPDPKEGYITLTTHNNKAAEINKQCLNELAGEKYTYKAHVQGDFNEYSYPVDLNLELKIGAQVMFVKNDPTGAQRFFNGKIGTVYNLSAKKIEVQFTDTGKIIEVEKYTWENMRYITNEVDNEIIEEVIGVFEQYPLKYAWAITVHKSQGLTFDKAVIDIGSAFAPGQVYVALSRLRSLDGLVLTSYVNQRGIEADSSLVNYTLTKENQGDLSHLANRATHEFLRNYLDTVFDFSGLEYQFRMHQSSYSKKDEKRSVKQQHAGWAKILVQQLESLKQPADKFLVQLNQLLTQATRANLDLLYKRLQAAKDYFEPGFKQLSETIFEKVKEIKLEKKIKTYLQELMTLEAEVFEKTKQLSKAILLAESALNNTTFTREDFQKLWSDAARSEKIKALLHISEEDREQAEEKRKAKKVKSPKEKKPKKTKEDTFQEETEDKKKPDSKAETLRLFKEGKTIQEISQTRGFALSTIEGHLAHFVAKGEMDVLNFLSDEKYSAICKELKATGVFELKVLKEKLGEDFSYGEIKMGVAGYLGDKNKE